jgi:4-amino-4-deoxy-L-arabinose transferase-like glycosyltransferase
MTTSRTLPARLRLGAWAMQPGLGPALTLLLFAAWLAATIGWRPLALPDEGRYASVAWEMLRSGNWLEPTLDGLPFLHKPPLWYWLSASAMSLFGVHPWAARLPSLAGALLTGAALFLFVRRWLDLRSARVALIVLATMPLVYGGAQYANHDMLVAAFITGAIVLAAHAALARDAGEPHRTALAFAYACAGLGVMTKGLIGAVLPGLVFAAWCLAAQRLRSLRMLAWAPGWLLLLAITMPWMAAMQLRHPDFLHYFFVVQHVQRYAGSDFNNQRGIWFYPAVLLVLGLPWSLCLWRVVGRRFFDEATGPQRELRLLMVVWLAVVPVFFSLPRSKLVGYILPAALPLACLAAEGLMRSRAPRPGNSPMAPPWLAALAGFSAMLCVGTVGGVAVFGNSVERPGVVAWRDAIESGDRLLMLDDYDYDLPFYLRLPKPVTVASEWHRAIVADDWRRELSDAGAFDPQAARTRLIERSDLPAWLCQPGKTWIFGDMHDLRSLGASHVVRLARDEALAEWRVDPGEAATRSCLARLAALPQETNSPPP